MGKDHPVVHWPSLVVHYEKEALVEDGVNDDKYMQLLQKYESKYNYENSESDDEEQKKKSRGGADEAYDSDDSFIDDDVEEGDCRVKTKVGGFFIAKGDSIDTLAMTKIEKPEKKTQKRSQKRKREADDEQSEVVQETLRAIRKKLASESEYTSQELKSISTDLRLRKKSHLKLLPFYLNLDLELFGGKAGIRNKIWSQVCSIIPYQNKNHKQLTELIEVYCEKILKENPDPNEELHKKKLDWSLKHAQRLKKNGRKKTFKKIKDSIKKAKDEKSELTPKKIPGWHIVRDDIYGLVLSSDKWSTLRRLNGHTKDTDKKSREELFTKLAELFPKKCKVTKESIQKIWKKEYAKNKIEPISVVDLEKEGSK